jgi:hypothetical protein
METKSFVTGGTGTQGRSVVSKVGTFHRPNEPESVVESVGAGLSPPDITFTSDGQLLNGDR